jgi:hypothetical protein
VLLLEKMLTLRYIICGFQALLLIGFDKGETDKVNSDVNLQNSSIFLDFGTNTF